MSNSSWTKSLNKRLAALRATISARPLRLALVGMGNEFNGDDAAGVLLARRLSALIPAGETLRIIDAGLAPENFTGPLKRFQPDLILLLDAGDFGGSTGEVALFDWRDVEGFSASTHTLPPSILAGYLHESLNCEIAILAVQSARTDFDAPLSPQVEQAVEQILHEILPILSE